MQAGAHTVASPAGLDTQRCRLLLTMHLTLNVTCVIEAHLVHLHDYSKLTSISVNEMFWYIREVIICGCDVLRAWLPAGMSSMALSCL